MITFAQHYSISALITSIAAILLALIVLLRASDRKLAIYFFWYTLTIAVWSFFVFACTSVGNHDLSFLLCQVCHAGGVFIPIAFLHFVQVYTQNHSKILSQIIRFSYVIISLISISIVFKPTLFMTDVVPKLTFNYFRKRAS